MFRPLAKRLSGPIPRLSPRGVTSEGLSGVERAGARRGPVLVTRFKLGSVLRRLRRHASADHPPRRRSADTTPKTVADQAKGRPTFRPLAKRISGPIPRLSPRGVTSEGLSERAGARRGPVLVTRFKLGSVLRGLRRPASADYPPRRRSADAPTLTVADQAKGRPTFRPLAKRLSGPIPRLSPRGVTSEGLSGVERAGARRGPVSVIGNAGAKPHAQTVFKIPDQRLSAYPPNRVE